MGETTREGRFDWPTLMRAGMKGLGLRPAEFWVLTPAELQFLLGDKQGAAPMGHARLSELLAAYPDAIGPGMAGPQDQGEKDG
ncbi:rcc01693 family protein [Rhodalgimonas zhirmunskyi]|uniref:Phage tail assembly chaperone n=1 Tax=Rhodalgimonas zhirmunskyi TaxID=2964767 RepID=A0AAJ1U3X1_9RHOB|nr:rcc01693 family protein [Rhodoalgimonas zhirmunskyi]MDQ2092534.1 phage tail assembly chaperone [Rhodoalgimonas zhirmunskyi]